ncbi:MAG: polyphosphate polymerase domain-containing protein [Clostridia bacterium]|nr:polyphosphate polymerase domain-containing protein [Clostridia bacterium]
MIQSVFERKEIKYLMVESQMRALIDMLSDRIYSDEYGLTTICSIYFDTPDYRLIRESIEKPMYKEKLRLRTYGTPKRDSTAFVELKKKFDGIVYKRRETLPYEEAMRFLCFREKPSRWSQIFSEIDWTLEHYGTLEPAMILCYDRIAYRAFENDDIRITFDLNTRFRNYELDLLKGTYGERLMGDDELIMELKISEAMPLWLSNALDELRIYPGTYTKYGNAYKRLLIGGSL